MQQQHQFQTLLQDNQLDEDVKKALAVIFCTDNAREKINIDEDIINAKDYLDNIMARDRNLATDWENADVKLRNHEENAENFLEELFKNWLKKKDLVYGII